MLTRQSLLRDIKDRVERLEATLGDPDDDMAELRARDVETSAHHLVRLIVREQAPRPSHDDPTGTER